MLAIIADDLTGALDASAPFAGRGLKTVVATGVGAMAEALAREPDVLAVNTGSREIAPDAAAGRVKAALDALPKGMALFKKVDSRLKGQVAVELAVFPHTDTIVVPAIPEFGRHVVDGAVCGFGVDKPISISAVLGLWADRAYVPDVRSVADMRAAVAARGPGTLLVGARGAADALARELSGKEARAVGDLGMTIGFVVGSHDPITLAQVARLRRDFDSIGYVAAPNGVAPGNGEIADAPVALLQAVPGSGSATGPEVARALADSLERLGFATRDTLLLSGGATAEAILEARGIAVLTVEGEVLEGLPVAKAGGMAIITKSGGFGAENALSVIARMVLGGKQ